MKLLVKFILAIFVVVLMVSSAIIGQQLQTTAHYNKPYFLTYFNTLFLLSIVPIQSIYFLITSTMFHSLSFKESIRELKRWIFPLEYYSISKFFGLSVVFGLLWFAANYLFVMGLALTTVTSSLSLEQLATVIVYILSLVVLTEKLKILKVIAVLLCIAGVIVVGFSDQNSSSDPFSKSALLGDLLIIISTIATAVYMVAYKRLLENLKLPAVNTLFSLIALSVSILFLPGLIICHWTGFEVLELPNSPKVFLLLIANGIISMLFNICLNWGIVISSPLFMRIVIICSIPTSFLVELLILKIDMNVYRALGALVIVVGFVVFSVVDSLPGPAIVSTSDHSDLEEINDEELSSTEQVQQQETMEFEQQQQEVIEQLDGKL